MTRKLLPLLGALACAMAMSATTLAQTQAQAPMPERDLDCRLDYNLSGWSLIYKRTSGEGVVTCDGGESVPVRVSAQALGLTVGRWQIDNGTGHFTDVRRIQDVFGTYVQASANVGLGKSGAAQVLTKGPVSLALAGAGAGVNIGVDIGQFKIDPAE